MDKNAIGKKKTSMKKSKDLWYGVFNGQHQVYYLYCYAYTAKQARVSFCRQISKKHNVPDWMTLQYYPEGADNHIIKLEMEFTEDD